MIVGEPCLLYYYYYYCYYYYYYAQQKHATYSKQNHTCSLIYVSDWEGA